MKKILAVYLFDINARSRKVTSVRPEDSVVEAAKLMKKNNIGLIVVLKNDKLVGVVSERDVVQRWMCGSKFPKDVQVSDIMTSQVEYVTTLDTVYDCYLRFVARRCRHLPVLDPAGHVIAVLSLREVSTYIIDRMPAQKVISKSKSKSKKPSRSAGRRKTVN